MDEQPHSRAVSLKVLPEGPPSGDVRAADDDPFAGIEVPG
jgi:hypothetical protein